MHLLLQAFIFKGVRIDVVELFSAVFVLVGVAVSARDCDNDVFVLDTTFN